VQDNTARLSSYYSSASSSRSSSTDLEESRGTEVPLILPRPDSLRPVDIYSLKLDAEMSKIPRHYVSRTLRTIGAEYVFAS
jgi:hypothetical protein